MNAGQTFAESTSYARREAGVKGKPFQSRQSEPQPTDFLGYPLKRPAASQISKVDWQSEKLTSEQWRFLNRVFSQFAEILPSNLTPILQLRAIVELEESTCCTFREFIDPFSDLTPFAIFNIDGKGKGLWAFDRSLSFSILDYLMGGKGDPIDEPREFTDLEKSLFQKQILSQFLSAYSDAWGAAASLSLQPEGMEFSSGRLILFSYPETLIAARFSLRLGAMIGNFFVALPFRQTREIVPKNPDEFVTQTALRKPQENQVNIAPIVGKKIEAAALQIVVELGSAEVPFQDLLNLEQGDILRLDTGRADALRIRVSGKTKFLGKPGARENKVAVQISQVLQEGDELYDE